MQRTNAPSGGRVPTYLQVVETYRDGKRVRQRVVKNLGREDQVDPREVGRLISSLAPYGTVPVGDTSGLEFQVIELQHAYPILPFLADVVPEGFANHGYSRDKRGQGYPFNWRRGLFAFAMVGQLANASRSVVRHDRTVARFPPGRFGAP